MEEEEQIIIESIPDSEETVELEKKDESLAKIEDKTVSGEEETKKEEIPEVVPSIQNIDEEKVVTRLSFNDVDTLSDGTSQTVPKTIDHLEQISSERYAQRKLEEDEDDDDDDDAQQKIKIHMDEPVSLTLDDVFDLDKDIQNTDLALDDIVDL